MLRLTPRRLLRLAVGGGVVGIATFGGCVAWVRAPARHRILDEQRLPSVPVALVLGAQVLPSGWPSAFLRGRLDLAKRLLDAGKVQRLLLSGAADASEFDEPKAMRAYLTALGVPAERLVEDPYGLDTYDSCARAKLVYGLDEVVLVSQTYHLPRAVGTARRLGLTAYGVGDESVRYRREPWISGTIRDQIACMKAVWDLLSRRKPILDDPGHGASETLRASQR